LFKVLWLQQTNAIVCGDILVISVISMFSLFCRSPTADVRMVKSTPLQYLISHLRIKYRFCANFETYAHFFWSVWTETTNHWNSI